ncbi:MAG: tetratricopeptide repeat protein [Verrucomicrobia bacterium]|jgi:TolA-binding protein|nr:tetratricopeptide repeat protein [Verrucomicrobiota bacterium]
MKPPFHPGLRQVLALICAAGLLCGGSLGAASFGENRAYTAAVKSFQDGMWEYAEAGCAQFVEKHPKSARVPEVVLLQAQAQFKQGKFAPAIALLTAQQGGAGPLADEYQYWMGEAQFQSTNYPAAAAAFGRLTRDFPASSRRLQASVGEAAAFAKLGDWPRVVALLQTPGGTFQSAANANPGAEPVARGRLLLAEAGLAQKKFANAEAALQPFASQKLKPELDWQWKFLLCRAQFGANQTTNALQRVGELLTLATATGRRDFLAESVALQGGILEQLGRRDEAIAAYTNNLAANAPVEQQRQALLKVTELTLAQGRLTGAVEVLEKFLNQFSNAPAADMALLTLGELHLKQHVALTQTNAALPGTNHLQRALGFFDRLVNGFPNSALAGKAELNRGWSFWLDGKVPESLAAFKTAAARLPPSEDLAVARFKLADAQFAQKDFAGALQNYQSALAAAADWPHVKDALTTQALYQIVRASLGATNLVAAEAAMRKILQAQPHGDAADHSVLLVGQGYADAEKPDAARALFEEFVQLSPDSELRPEVELLMTQARYQTSDWPAAIGEYEAWVGRFPTNHLRPQAEFYRALANFQAGNETNALNLFTNFVTQFATHALAPQAQWWVADYFFRRGDFPGAEKNYRLVFLNWPDSELAYEARMMAGRAAFGWQNYAVAIECFTNLASRLDCPPDLWAQAVFAYGDTLMVRGSAETNQFANYEEAIRVFGKIHERNPTNEMAALAWGEMAKCYRQIQDASNAVASLAKVIESPAAKAAARSEAQVGLGVMLEEQAQGKPDEEKRALLKRALAAYLPVVYEENLRPGETRDLFWVKEAGLKAASVVETLGEWERAEKLYRRLQELLPPLRAGLETKIERAKNLAGGKN